MADTAHTAAPLLPRKKRFSFADVEAMWRAGVIDEGGKEELLEGELWIGGAPRAFSAQEARVLVAADIVEADDMELLGGEIWEIASEGAGHVDLKVWLNEALIRQRPPEIRVACDSTLSLSPTHAPSPDFYLFPSDLRPSAVRGPDVLLLIEIADTSLQKDLMIKGPKYRDFGVLEYWVIDLEAGATHIHLRDGAWPEPIPVPFEIDIAPHFAPELKLRLAKSGL